MNSVLLFSGQGSQYVGMIKDLAERYPEVREMLRRADDILGYSLSSICFEGPADTLKETRYTQPALFVHEAILVTLLREHLSYQAVAGHSLGEYSALFAAGVVDFETALGLVRLRGELMFRAGEQQPGTMFAVVGLEDDAVQAVCQSLHKPDTMDSIVVAANFNSPGQVVVSGSAEYLRSNAETFKQAGAKLVKELPVSGAFHSPLMESAKQELERAIYGATMNDASVDIYANCTAQPLRKADEIRGALVQQLVAPVLWTQSMLAMQNNGISAFYELGPGMVLQGLVKRTLQNVTIRGFDTAAQVEALRSGQ